MAIDGLSIRALTKELAGRIIGSKIDKIFQPSQLEIVLNLRHPSGPQKLLLSASPNSARVSLTSDLKGNPLTPPPFCMLLRKYIQDGRISAVSQPGMDRIIELTIDAWDDYGDLHVYKLRAEMMGKHSNIILLKSDGAIVLDSIKRIGHSVNRHRELLPGRCYVPPPAQGKIDIDNISRSDAKAIFHASDSGKKVSKQLIDNIAGIGPAIAREIIFRAGIKDDLSSNLLRSDQIESLCDELVALSSEIRDEKFVPVLLLDQSGEPADFSVLIPSRIDANCIRICNTFSEGLEILFAPRDRKETLEQTKRDLVKTVESALSRVSNKLLAQQAELKDAENGDIYRIYADAIMSGLHTIHKGDISATLVNYHDPDLGNVQVPLDPSLSASDNAKAYFKRYNRAKKGLEIITQNIEQSKLELIYLENVSVSLDQAASVEDLEEIRLELETEGYIKNARNTKRTRPQKKSGPMRFETDDGTEILVGRNNHQNDELTLKVAAPNDLWFHVKDIAGSHVILRTHGANPDDVSILSAALLAAYFSKGRMSSNVPVDYTQKKHVRKPQGAKPGMVIYEKNRTQYVTPEGSLLSKLLEQQNMKPVQ